MDIHPPPGPRDDPSHLDRATGISRVWHGWTSPANADAYEQLLLGTILPGIAARGIPGYRGAYLFRRPLGDSVEFVTTMLFDSMDGVRGFAGEHTAESVVPAAARALLERFDAHAAHYAVLLTPAGTPRTAAEEAP